MKALKIDSANRTVTEIELGNGLQPIYDAIGNGCGTFTCPVRLPNNDMIYCDDEGLYHPFAGGFTFFDWNYPIVGNALIIGHNNEGKSIDVKTQIDEVQSAIIWVGKKEATAWSVNFNK